MIEYLLMYAVFVVTPHGSAMIESDSSVVTPREGYEDKFCEKAEKAIRDGAAQKYPGAELRFKCESLKGLKPSIPIPLNDKRGGNA